MNAPALSKMVVSFCSLSRKWRVRSCTCRRKIATINTASKLNNTKPANPRHTQGEICSPGSCPPQWRITWAKAGPAPLRQVSTDRSMAASTSALRPGPVAKNSVAGWNTMPVSTTP